MTPEQEFTLTHLGIERWVVRTWPLQANTLPAPLFWVVHDEPTLEGSALRLLQNILRCFDVTRDQVQIISAHQQPVLPTQVPVYRVSLQHLLTHPADKKQAYRDVLQVKQGLLACGHLV